MCGVGKVCFCKNRTVVFIATFWLSLHLFVMFSQQKLIERTLIKNIKETPFRVEKIENTVSSRATDDISNGYLDL